MSQVSDSALGLLEARVSREGGVVTLAITGEFDLASVDVVRAKFAEACSGEPSQIFIDLSGLTFIDSTGISFLLSTVKADEMGRLNFIGCGSPAVQRVFTVTGVAELFGGTREAPP